MVKKDAAVVVITLAAAVVLWAATRIPQGGDTLSITVDGELFATCSLSEDTEIKINDTNVLTVSGGAAYMSYANCPDKLCIHQGKISDSSKSIVCLPNKVVVTADKKGEEADAVSR